ncbi:MAG: AMP-binding protein [Tetrasphaera sp.]
MGMSLNWVTDSVAATLPSVAEDKSAVALGSEAMLTWRELRELELRCAQALRAAGVRRGDRVGLLLRNSVEYVALYLAVARAGAMSVRVNWRLSAPEIGFILGDSGASVLIFGAEFAAAVDAQRHGSPVQTFVAIDDGSPVPEWAQPFETFADTLSVTDGLPELDMSDGATLMYTSGTTGRPKGAVLTHGNSLWTASIQTQKWRFDGNSVAVTSGPLFHAGGFEVLLLPALVNHGTAVTFPSGGFTLEQLLNVSRTRSATKMLVYPFMLTDMLRLPDLEQLVPSTLEAVVTGGDTVMPWVYEEFSRRLPGVELIQSYGLTEGGAVSACLDHDLAKDHESSIGRPQALTEIKLVDSVGREVQVGEVGEVCVRSPAVSPGYWNLPEANASTFVDGWCHTGDLARIDADGFLTLAGRAKDMYRSGGENVYPAEVEKVLTGHEHVADAAVVGVPDVKFIEVGAAMITAKEGIEVDVDALRAYCLERLAKYKVPRYFHVVTDLPRNANGKVLKAVIRAQLTEPSQELPQ